MEIRDLAGFDADTRFEADLVIVGGGPAGLTIAREFAGTSTRVLLLESGLAHETPEHGSLAEVESIGEPRTEAQKHKRLAFHGASSSSWTQAIQPYGVRCRALGGSTHAWAGKSAAFDAIDFEQRPWVPHSGWPIARQSLSPYLDRAADVLNLGPNVYDDELWQLMGASIPKPSVDAEVVRSFFWQFARSRVDHLDVMRFGREFAGFSAPNIRVLLNATATRINLSHSGTAFDHLEIATLSGVRHSVRARHCVLAASGIENPRLLLASNNEQASGIGNAHDLVGRFLMDHPGARIGRLGSDRLGEVGRLFGFYGVRHHGRTHMYMRGLAPTAALQQRERLLNCAVYLMPQLSPDDPWDALKRLLQRKSDHALQDMFSLFRGGPLLAKGLAMKALASDAIPARLKDLVVNTAIRFRPNLVADEFLSRGLPHKVTAISIDAICEQRPDPSSRLRLSDRTDRLGVPIAQVDWHIHPEERNTIVRLGHLIGETFSRAGLPKPVLEPWVAAKRPDEAVIIDMAHTMGTTRMSDDPKKGVVDRNCRVHGVRGLHVAGSSVFPTSGHANPTLMLLALAIRLADQLKTELAAAS
jgi:choline dehydrogenase-like flavoprotein